MKVEIHLNRLNEWPSTRGRAAALERAARAALDSGDADPKGELSLTFVTEEEIVRLNRDYLDRAGVTDVIAFELGDGRSLIGDVYIAPRVAERNAREHGLRPEEEITRLVVHGTLHVMGHDHPEGVGREESPMFVLQESLVRELVRHEASEA